MALLGVGGAPSIAIANPILFGMVGDGTTYAPAMIDPTTGVAASVGHYLQGAMPPPVFDLAYDPTDTTPYGVASGRIIFMDNVITQQVTQLTLTAPGFAGSAVSGLAVDPVGGELFGMVGDGTTYTPAMINPTTGVATSVGGGHSQVAFTPSDFDLAYDSANTTLYGVASGNNNIFV